MRLLTRALCLLALSALARPALADEIQLKDGKTFYGTIVGYDNKMFKIKTDFGFIYVEKDKIASIIPNHSQASQPAAANGTPNGNAAKGSAKPQAMPTDRVQPETRQPVKASVVLPTAEPAVE